uniref:Uncharacterized protein n=1 Tax=Knipowitschia caucasica TaxID=637954 RepID=A0AAV2L6S7_KNICA
MSEPSVNSRSEPGPWRSAAYMTWCHLYPVPVTHPGTDAPAPPVILLWPGRSAWQPPKPSRLLSHLFPPQGSTF